MWGASAPAGGVQLCSGRILALCIPWGAGARWDLQMMLAGGILLVAGLKHALLVQQGTSAAGDDTVGNGIAMTCVIVFQAMRSLAARLSTYMLAWYIAAIWKAPRTLSAAVHVLLLFNH